MCGEQPVPLHIIQRCHGSPPRVRGTAALDVISFFAVRITPACAGNSLRIPHTCTISWDHPRVCGEQASYWSAVAPVMGSPPRVRGTERGLAFVGEPGRITPACAGNRHS